MRALPVAALLLLTHASGDAADLEIYMIDFELPSAQGS
jgi:hypothetical protein